MCASRTIPRNQTPVRPRVRVGVSLTLLLLLDLSLTPNLTLSLTLTLAQTPNCNSRVPCIPTTRPHTSRWTRTGVNGIIRYAKAHITP